MKDWKKVSKVLIPLSLMSVSSAFADNGDCGPQVNNCCPVDCCKPCCVPCPRKYINCECYNPQFYFLQCDWGAFVDVEFLYWYARESNLEFAFKTEIDGFRSASNPLAVVFSDRPVDHFYTKTEWDPGFRVGIGWNSSCDGWDLYLNWTWYKTEQEGHAEIPLADFAADFSSGAFNGKVGFIATTLVNPWNPGGSINVSDAGEHFIDSKWHLRLNQIDLELGRRYWVSKCMTLRPYIGLRGAWTRTNFNIIGDSTGPATSFFDPGTGVTVTQTTTGADTNHFHQKIWGVGLLGGLQPVFRLGSWCGCGEFSIYGNVDAALLWGKWRSRNRMTHNTEVLVVESPGGTTDVFQTFDNTEHDGFARMQGILDLAIGLRWEDTWCCDRYMTSIDIGWEHHYWWDFGLYHRSTAAFFDRTSFADQLIRTSLIENLSNTTTNLGFGGLVVRARFDF